MSVGLSERVAVRRPGEGPRPPRDRLIPIRFPLEVWRFACRKSPQKVLPVVGSRDRSFWITGVAVLISVMGSSVKNTVQVSFEPMAESYGEPRGAFALATTMFALTIAVASPIVGVLSDTLGPLVVLRSGLVVSAGMFVSLSFAQNFVLLAVLYGTLGAIGYASLSYIPIGVLADRAFPPERRGFFYALLTNGTALGFILLVPLWIWLESVTTWQSVMLALGASSSSCSSRFPSPFASSNRRRAQLRTHNTVASAE